MAVIDSVKLPDNSTYDVADNYSGYAKKVSSATTDDLASLTATGDLADSGKKLSDLVLKSSIVSSLTSTATDVPLAANMGKTLEDEVRSLTNPNLLDNPFFTVNQRAQSSYTGTVYSVDRWKGLSAVSTITPNANGVAITRPSGDYWVLQQILDRIPESNVLTVSVKHANGLSKYTFNNGFDNSSQHDANTYVWLWTNGTLYAVYVGIIGNSLQLNAVKLEVGSISTLANDVAPDYAEELARCQTSTADSNDTYANQGQLVTSAIQGIYGSINQLPFPYFEVSKVENGLTFTVNNDGTITISGTASADTFFVMRSNLDNWKLETGRYIASMEGSSNNIVMFLNRYNGATYVSSLALVGGDEEPFEIDYNGYDREDAGLYVLANTVISTPITVKPMIRDSRIVDKTRVPFAMTNRQLTERIIVERRTVNIEDTVNKNYNLGVGSDYIIYGFMPDANTVIGDIFVMYSGTASKWYLHLDSSQSAPSTMTGKLVYGRL